MCRLSEWVFQLDRPIIPMAVWPPAPFVDLLDPVADGQPWIIAKHRTASTITTSNRAPDELLAMLADPLLATGTGSGHMSFTWIDPNVPMRSREESTRGQSRHIPLRRGFSLAELEERYREENLRNALY